MAENPDTTFLFVSEFFTTMGSCFLIEMAVLLVLVCTTSN